jgi:hypothetical protein
VRGYPFVEFGYGEEIDFQKRWHERVIEDHALWNAFGHPPFDLRALPSPMFQAHLSILEGKAIKRQEQADEAEEEQP